MGKLNPFSAPKTPAPVVYTPPEPVVVSPPKVEEIAKGNEVDTVAERKRRAAAQGRTGTIASSLADATTDANASTYRSTLLGG